MFKGTLSLLKPLISLPHKSHKKQLNWVLIGKRKRHRRVCHGIHGKDRIIVRVQMYFVYQCGVELTGTKPCHYETGELGSVILLQVDLLYIVVVKKKIDEGRIIYTPPSSLQKG